MPADDRDEAPPPLTPEQQALLEEMRAQVKGEPDASRKLEWLLDALIMRKQLPDRFKKLVKHIQADRGPRVHLAIYDDKYSIESPDVPCLELIPLCKGRCCGFRVPLTEQDVRDGNVPWDLQEPYVIQRDPQTKRCGLMHAETGACGVYEHRPAVCRAYDCRSDDRVWIDYEKRIPAPMPY